ncbi:hypothetical protein ACQPZJ_37900 [Actinoplanes sp. CA-054009]
MPRARRAALSGTVNTLPVALLSLGAAVLAAGLAPRAAIHAGPLPTTGGFLLLVLADSADAPSWLRSLSPFAHLAPVPLESADFTAAAVMVAVSLLLTAAGLASLRRRDLTG